MKYSLTRKCNDNNLCTSAPEVKTERQGIGTNTDVEVAHHGVFERGGGGGTKQ